MLKSELVTELATALRDNVVLEQELKVAKAANNTTNKVLQDEQSETHRLRKVLDRAITAIDSRISTLIYDVQPMPKYMMSINPSAIDISEAKPPVTNVALTEEQKFLGFVKIGILHNQYKPQDKDEFGCGFGMGLYR